MKKFFYFVFFFIAFITSAQDTSVSAACTKCMAYALVKAGHPAVYLLELEHSRHSGYVSDNGTDKETYQAFVHDLYQKYGLSYIPAYACAGKTLLEQTRLLA